MRRGFHFNRDAGLGDMIQALSAIMELRKKTGETPMVTTGHTRWNEIFKEWPGIEFCGIHNSTPQGFSDTFPEMHGRVEWYERNGLDWGNKRIYCHVPIRFKESSEWLWGGGRPRVLVQHHGASLESKSHPGFIGASATMRGMGWNVIDLDEGRLFGHPPEALVVAKTPLMEMMGLCSTADLFVGFDSGPLFVALGNLVPSVAVVCRHRPDEIYLPVTEPRQFALFSDRPDKIPVQDVVARAVQLLG